MYRLGVLLLAGCGFHGPGLTAGGDAPLGDHDAPGAVDAALHDAFTALDVSLVTADAAPACTVQTGAFSPIGYIGGTGGQTANAVICAGDGVPVGIELAMTQAPLNNHGNMPAVVDISVRCGTIRRTSTGWTTTYAEVVNRVGATTSNCSQFFTPISTGEMLCPQGAALTGISGNMLDTSMYNTFTATCTSLGDGGTTALAFPASGNFSNQPKSVACPTGQIAKQFGIKEACGQDQLALVCALYACN